MMKTILAPAKINLFLEAGAVQKGFHPLVSLIDIINLSDIIEIEESDKTSVVFEPQSGIPSLNTVTKSVALLKEKFHIKENFNIRIIKQIPQGSGLGGGSSDAAFVIKSILRFCSIAPGRRILLETGAAVGKDVPIFFDCKRCIAEGFGERIKPVSSSPVLHYLLFIPSFKVSTGDVYNAYDSLGLFPDLTESGGKIKIILDCIQNLDIEGIEKNINNSLSAGYFTLYPESREVKGFIEKKVGKRFFVSGSGGTLFAVFAKGKDAKETAERIHVAGWKSFVVESMGTS